MADHNLKKAQSLYESLLKRDYPASKLESKIEDIYVKLRQSQRLADVSVPDISVLKPVFGEDVKTALDACKADAARLVDAHNAAWVIAREKNQGVTVYTPEPDWVMRSARMIPALQDAGISTEMFENDQRPLISQIEPLVSAAVETAEQAWRAGAIGKGVGQSR